LVFNIALELHFIYNEFIASITLQIFAMKKFFTLIQFLLFPILFSSAQIVFNNLEEYTKYAVTHNINIKEAQLNQKLEKQNTNSAIAPLLPTAKASATLSDNLIINTQLIPAEIFGGPEGTFREVRFGTKYALTPNADISVNLINAANYQNLMIAKKNQTLADWQAKLTTEQIKINLTQAYYLYLLLKKNGDFAISNKANADSLYALVDIRYKNQFVDEVDLNRAKSLQINANSQLRESLIAISKAMGDLKLLAGIPMKMEVQITEDLSAANQAELSDINSVSQSRPAVQFKKVQLELSEMAIKREKLKFVPELTAFANYGYQGFNNDFTFFSANQSWFGSSAIGIKLDVPIFNGGIRFYNLEKSKLNYQKAKLESKNALEQQIKEDNELMLDQIKMFDELRSKSLLLQLAERNYNLAMIKYKNQAINYDNLINIQNELTNAQQQQLKSQSDFFALKTKIEITNSYSK
jgi:outer membrane protein TolC